MSRCDAARIVDANADRCREGLRCAEEYARFALGDRALAGALRGILCQRLVPRADGRGRAVVMEVCVNTGRVADAIADPAKTSMLPMWPLTAMMPRPSAWQRCHRAMKRSWSSPSGGTRRRGSSAGRLGRRINSRAKRE